ncbi:MAG: tRNA preQ1(34) S-adenosylmethionine ribosyltransferase-isomerase QueA [Gammaproteobacteria bacterium]|nr:tRNA preQ1(34) S-adenosylmethionine ribosyltransferase-isomerase QueA [Gammaproteobacteria bacterium]MCP4088950.1 tRNA preQ1(34) S-adenosylmethionine ribosyltransferase-isomerase QueA [Gammaproteobacteria bacterium]MCP4274967.1 tRNA preQ1(34) S-adenosylmethionine ribosyltransferase-isomerase QueA [Gammaproteobacteria bacterium]MCP4831966.1 tRNA preQ1(34) S-adenosylmethionine ribosyltransferase-isomerase QueA [Gammaproteobacteria bacterium]MCP4929401.1 tRNA preQ1(34) S-adenosylmethionine ribo
MDPANFHYDLPVELIAQEPLARREASRLLYVPVAGDYQECQFSKLSQLLQAGDLLIFNDTRVIPGRLYGHKSSGGKVEMLLERLLEPDLALAQLRSSRSPGEGSELVFEPDITAVVEGRQGTFFLLRFESDLQPILEQYGHIPLPPYIQREDQDMDRDRYQTVFAREPGAVAAPTAGLHFNDELLVELEGKGIELAKLTLHVGAGTFLPLRTEQIESGRLHCERIIIDEDVCAAVSRTRKRGGRVIAVGTTVVRALESAAVAGETGAVEPLCGETDIFIRPGYKFQVVDAMITNFHLPESSLLMLVSAFHGSSALLDAYQYAVRHKFRFFSYGDAMFLEKKDVTV